MAFLLKQFPLHFLSFDRRLENERKSKLLDPKSELYNYLEGRRNGLVTRYGDQVGPKRMDFHVELIKEDLQNEEDITNQLVKLAKEMENKSVSIKEEQMKKALVIPIASTPYHITVAFFPGGFPSDLELVSPLSTTQP